MDTKIDEILDESERDKVEKERAEENQEKRVINKMSNLKLKGLWKF